MHDQKKGETICESKPFISKTHLQNEIKGQHCDDCWVIKVANRHSNPPERRQQAA